MLCICTQASHQIYRTITNSPPLLNVVGREGGGKLFRTIDSDRYICDGRLVYDIVN